MANFAAIKELKKTRWYKPAAERWRIHRKACVELQVESETFDVFASEVLNTPEDRRDWLLTPEPLGENLGAFTRFRQYETPVVSEMANGLFYRDYRGKK